MPLELCGGGGQLIDPVHVADVAESLCDAIGGPYGMVTEAGCGKPVTVAQVARDVGRAAGGAILNPAAARAGEPVGAAVVAMAPACRNPWPHLVAETVDWYREWLSKHPST
jgi:nucleoside-diphosphate-sugar epimerase